MCAHCYAQLELLDKYERDRRQLERKATTIQAELMNTFRGTIDPDSTISPPSPPASAAAPASSAVVPVSSAAPFPSVVPPSTIVLAPVSKFVLAPTSAAAPVVSAPKLVTILPKPAPKPASAAETDDTDDAERKAKRRRYEVKPESPDDELDRHADADDGHAADADDGDLLNGKDADDSENESDYVEINVASIAGAAATPFRVGPANGGEEDHSGEDEDDPAEDGASDPEDELYPLAGEMVDVKQELAGSDVSDVDLDEVSQRTRGDMRRGALV